MQLSPRLPWHFLLGAVVLVPLAVGVIPLAGTPLMLNAFVQAKLIVLCVALALALASWAATALRDGTLYSGRTLLPLAVFLLAAAASNAAAIDPRLAFFGDFEQGVGLLVLVLCGLACYLTTQIVRDDGRLTMLTSAVVLTATGVAAIGLLQQVLRIDLLGIGASIPEWVVIRGYGTIGNADTYGAYLVLPALLALHRMRHADTRKDRLTWAACFLAIAASCIAALTRGPIVGLLVGGVAYAAGEPTASRQASAKGRKPARTGRGSTAPARFTGAVVAAGVGVGVFVAAVLGNGVDFANRFGGSMESVLSLGGRLPLWSSALRVATAYPALGIGPDSFRLGWYPVRDIAGLAGGVGLVITDPHSVPLLIASTMGITGLLAAGYLFAVTVITGFKTASGIPAGKRSSSDYPAWLYAALALSVTFLTSMITSALAFMAFLAIGVILAPALDKREAPPGPSRTIAAIRALSLLAAAALLVFGILSGAAQVIAVGTRTDDADLARGRAAAAVSLAPWDTGLRRLEYETMVTSALEHVFTGEADAAAVVDATDAALTDAARREPREYLYPYRAALLLIGSGQRLGAAYTRRGIGAGERGLEIYPNSLELRTGMASGYLQLGEPDKADTLLRGVWGADPAYLMSGVTYFEALVAQGKSAEARAAYAVLSTRFPEDPALIDLEKKISSD